jgi:hypothetical protein
MPLSVDRRRALVAYAEQLRDRLRLQAWDLDVSEEAPASGSSILEIVPHKARHSGSIRVGSFFDVDRREQRYTVAHELVHLLQAELWEFFDDPQPWHDRVSADLVDDLKQKVMYELEVQADAVARWIAPSMPLPPAWPK